MGLQGRQGLGLSVRVAHAPPSSPSANVTGVVDGLATPTGTSIINFTLANGSPYPSCLTFAASNAFAPFVQKARVMLRSNHSVTC